VVAPEGGEGLIHVYRMPADYAALRERVNVHIEQARTAMAEGDGGAPARMLRSEAARGPLTAWSVGQIEKLLEDIDINRYAQKQTIFEHRRGGRWTPLAEEHYVSFDELRRAWFPHLEVAAPEHLFLALCHAIDRRFLAAMTEHFDAKVAGQPVHLNISVASVMDAGFVRFAHKAPRGDRAKIAFELHRGDLLQDFTLTLNAMTLLHREGFRVVLDGVTPDMLGYLNLAAFEADCVKINVTQARVGLLGAPAALKALEAIPREKIIFFRCDNEPALDLGLELGVTKFQGWLPDARAKGG
jgi:hypothetical protein